MSRASWVRSVGASQASIAVAVSVVQAAAGGGFACRAGAVPIAKGSFRGTP